MIGSKKHKKLKHLEFVEKDLMKHFQRFEQFESAIYSKCQEVVQNFCTSVESHVVEFVRETVQNMVPDFANTYLDELRRSDAIVSQSEVYQHRMKKKHDKKLKQAQQRENVKNMKTIIAKTSSKGKNLPGKAKQQQHGQKMKKNKITRQPPSPPQQQLQQQLNQFQCHDSDADDGGGRQQQQQQQQPSNVKRIKRESQTTNVAFTPLGLDPFSLGSTSPAAQHNAKQSSEAVSVFNDDTITAAVPASRCQHISGDDAQKSKGSYIPSNARKLHHAASLRAHVQYTPQVPSNDKARSFVDAQCHRHGTRQRQSLTIPDCSVCSKEKGVATPLGKGSCQACWNSLDPSRADPKQRAGAILKVCFLFVFSVTAPHDAILVFIFILN
jgi:hypothetical protein